MTEARVRQNDVVTTTHREDLNLNGHRQLQDNPGQLDLPAQVGVLTTTRQLPMRNLVLKGKNEKRPAEVRQEQDMSRRYQPVQQQEQTERCTVQRASLNEAVLLIVCLPQMDRRTNIPTMMDNFQMLRTLHRSILFLAVVLIVTMARTCLWLVFYTRKNLRNELEMTLMTNLPILDVNRNLHAHQQRKMSTNLKNNYLRRKHSNTRKTQTEKLPGETNLQSHR